MQLGSVGNSLSAGPENSVHLVKKDLGNREQLATGLLNEIEDVQPKSVQVLNSDKLDLGQLVNVKA